MIAEFLVLNDGTNIAWAAWGSAYGYGLIPHSMGFPVLAGGADASNTAEFAEVRITHRCRFSSFASPTASSPRSVAGMAELAPLPHGKKKLAMMILNRYSDGIPGEPGALAAADPGSQGTALAG